MPGRFDTALDLLLQGLVRVLPHAAARPLGSLAGELEFRLVRTRRRTALGNLECAYPELERRRRLALARGSFRRLRGAALETRSLARLDLVGLCRRLSLSGWEHLETAARRGRGVLIQLAPLGSPQLAAWAVGVYRGPLHLALDRQRLPRSWRPRFGIHAVPPAALPRLLQILAAGGCAALWFDPAIDSSAAETARFLGRPHSTTTALAELSLRSGAPVVPVFGLPRSAGRIKVVAQEPIVPPDPDRGDPAALTRRYLAALEQAIAPAAELWPWMKPARSRR